MKQIREYNQDRTINSVSYELDESDSYEIISQIKEFISSTNELPSSNFDVYLINPFTEEDTIFTINPEDYISRNDMMALLEPSYGIYLARLQPIHNGHKQIIDDIISRGFTPVVILGSSQESDTMKNPYSVQERTEMVRLLYPDIKVLHINDNSDWNHFFDSLIQVIENSLLTNNESHEHITFFTHSKPEDLKSFEFRGVQYSSEYYTKMFELEGFNLINIESSEHPVRASLIRDNLELYKHNLDAKVYHYIINNNKLGAK